MKKQYTENVGAVERGTLVNKVLLSELKKYRCKKDSSTIFVSILDTG